MYISGGKKRLQQKEYMTTTVDDSINWDWKLQFDERKLTDAVACVATCDDPFYGGVDVDTIRKLFCGGHVASLLWNQFSVAVQVQINF
jgi:hypothetical protein